MSYDVHTILDEGLVGADDETVWAATQAEKRFLITPDTGFTDARKLPAGSHVGILLLRFEDAELASLVEGVLSIFRIETVEEWTHCCVVATAQKVQVIRPAEKIG